MGRWKQASRRGSSLATAAAPPAPSWYELFSFTLAPNTANFRVPGGLHTKYWKARCRTHAEDPWVTCPFSFQDSMVACTPVPGMENGHPLTHQAAEFAAGDVFIGPWSDPVTVILEPS